MKSRLDTWQYLLADAGRRCSVDSTLLDLNTVKQRLKSEGEPFFTLTLPSFGKDLEEALSVGHIPSHLFSGYARTLTKVKVTHPENGSVRIKKGRWGTPRFLGGFLDLIFETDWEVTWDEWNTALQVVSSSPLQNHNFFPPRLRIPESVAEEERMANAIQAVRQLSMAFSKEKAMPHQSKIDEAIESYVDVDEELGALLHDPKASAAIFAALDDVVKAFSLAFGRTLLDLDRKVYEGEFFHPKHGPGATADRKIGNEKWQFTNWHERLEYLFPFVEYGLPNLRWFDSARQVRFLSEPEETPARLIAVPKTAKTPRLICAEPVCMQYIQQAIKVPLTEGLERDALSRRLVGFTDQEPNRLLAYRGSVDGSLATLDLSEASDRVSNWLVEALLEPYPNLAEAVDACRTRRVQLPDGRIIQVVKFASMGSALTFPIEAMVFTAIVLASIARASHLPLSRTTIGHVANGVRVFGDDIIVPTDFAEVVIGDLEVFGLKVNRSKSFWTGEFRESCGKEYWKGHDVSIVKFRKPLPTSRRDADELISIVDTRNLLYKAGYVDTAISIDQLVEPILWGFYPVVGENSSVLGRKNGLPFYQVDRLHPDYHSPVVKGWIPNPTIPRNEIEDLAALTKCLSGTIGMPDVDPKHLTHSGRPRAASIKLAWTSPF